MDDSLRDALDLIVLALTWRDLIAFYLGGSIAWGLMIWLRLKMDRLERT